MQKSLANAVTLNASRSVPLPGRADLAYLAAVGERVRTVRARRGMSRKILSRDSGVSERYLASLEAGRGNVSILLLKQIAQAMNVAVEELTRSTPEVPTELALIEQWLARLSPGEARRALRWLRREFGIAAPARMQRIALIGARGAACRGKSCRATRACRSVILRRSRPGGGTYRFCSSSRSRRR
ncbi:MAG: helix-turn-helix domain-containing protein [Betaproteobacteria bacterium]|nr:MAG: helix-turn-helix domain-containing protein [Betaproteobacteria bacterium]